MQERGLRATPKKKYVMTKNPNHGYNIYTNLLNQGFGVDKLNKVWVTDIKYVWTLEEGFGSQTTILFK